MRNYANGKPKWSIAKALKRLGEYHCLVLMVNHKCQVYVEQMIKVSAKHNQAQASTVNTGKPNLIPPLAVRPTVSAHNSEALVAKTW